MWFRCCDNARMRNDHLSGRIFADRVYGPKFLVQYNAPIVLILLFSCICSVLVFFFKQNFYILGLIRRPLRVTARRTHLLPEHIMVAVDLLPFLRVLQYPTVSHHGAADTLRAVAAILPVIQHLPAGRRVEGRESVHQSCRPTNQSNNLDET